MPPWRRGERDGDGDGGNDASACDVWAGKQRSGQEPTEEAARTGNALGAQDLASRQAEAREGCDSREGKNPTDTLCVAAKPTQACTNGATHTPGALPAKRAGRRLGAPSHGREQQLVPTRFEQHRPMCCAACLQPLPTDQTLQAWTGWDTLELLNLDGTDAGAPAAPDDLNDPAAPVTLGLRIEGTHQLLMQPTCTCGHTTRAQACRAEDDFPWSGVDIGEQPLLGPLLAATVVYRCLHMWLPRRKVSDLLLDLLGLQLSAVLIDQAVHQAARSVEPMQDQLAQQIAQAVILHVDETIWPERALVLWLWVLLLEPHGAVRDRHADPGDVRQRAERRLRR